MASAARKAAEDWLRINDSIPYAPGEHEGEHVKIIRDLLAEQSAAWGATLRPDGTIRVSAAPPAASDEVYRERDLLRDRLDQFEAYAITVSSALADRAYVEALGNDLALTRGAMAADDARLRAAAIRVWGDDYHGCDTPDAMADYIEHLRDRLSEETDPNAPQRPEPRNAALARGGA